MACPYRQIRVRQSELGISGLERCAAAKFAKIGFRRIKNILETPAGPVLLVLTLRERRNSEKTRTKKRKKPRNFSVHDVPAPETRHTGAVSKDRAGSAPAAASAYFTDSSYVRTILQLVNKQMGLTPRGLPIPYERNRLPRARVPHPRSTYPTHSATTQRGENCCAVLLACSRLQTLKRLLSLHKSVQKNTPGYELSPGPDLAERDGRLSSCKCVHMVGHFGCTGSSTSFVRHGLSGVENPFGQLLV
jgi:hypothetical protein